MPEAIPQSTITRGLKMCTLEMSFALVEREKHSRRYRS